jgi:hypothetical protein
VKEKNWRVLIQLMHLGPIIFYTTTILYIKNTAKIKSLPFVV